MSENDWKSRLGVVYSTNPDFSYDTGSEGQEKKTPAAGQDLRVWLDRRKGGKVVTIVRGYKGSADSLKKLGAMLKAKCGVGGTVKDWEILIQGDFRDRIVGILQNEGHKVKKAGG